MDISKINSTAYLQKNFDEFENLDFWQLKKILELIEKARNTPTESEEDELLDRVAELEDEVESLEDKLDDANDDYDSLQYRYDELKRDYDKLEADYISLQNGIE